MDSPELVKDCTNEAYGDDNYGGERVSWFPGMSHEVDDGLDWSEISCGPYDAMSEVSVTNGKRYAIQVGRIKEADWQVRRLLVVHAQITNKDSEDYELEQDAWKILGWDTSDAYDSDDDPITATQPTAYDPDEVNVDDYSSDKTMTPPGEDRSQDGELEDEGEAATEDVTLDVRVTITTDDVDAAIVSIKEAVEETVTEALSDALGKKFVSDYLEITVGRARRRADRRRSLTAETVALSISITYAIPDGVTIPASRMDQVREVFEALVDGGKNSDLAGVIDAIDGVTVEDFESSISGGSSSGGISTAMIAGAAAGGAVVLVILVVIIIIVVRRRRLPSVAKDGPAKATSAPATATVVV